MVKSQDTNGIVNAMWWWMIVYAGALLVMCAVFPGCTIDVEGGVRHEFSFLPNDPCGRCLPRCGGDGVYFCQQVDGDPCVACEVACLEGSDIACYTSGRAQCFNRLMSSVDVPTVCVKKGDGENGSTTTPAAAIQ